MATAAEAVAATTASTASVTAEKLGSDHMLSVFFHPPPTGVNLALKILPLAVVWLTGS